MSIPVLKIIVGIIALLLVVVGVGWLGLRVRMTPFPLPAQQANSPATIAIHTDLPAPVLRYAQTVFQGEIPIIESALVIGSADLTFNGITFPARFKFYHDAGNAYYHFIQLGWFGQPVITVNERYLDGVAIMDIPGGRITDEEKVNAAANLGLWAESVWLPSVFFTDERVQWETVDNTTAQLVVPDAAAEEAIVVRFDEQSGLITEMMTMRYQNPDSTERTRWTNRVLEWQEFNGVLVPALADLQWGDDAPWAVWRVEAVRYNLDLSGRFNQFGGEYKD